MTSFIPAIAGIAAFLVTAFSGFFIIPWLRKLKFGQVILDIGPSWHKNKQGTPTMGGMMFALGTVVALIVAIVTDYFTDAGVFFVNTAAMRVQNAKVFAGLFLAVGLGVVGFLDDFTKIAKKRNLGLTAKQKSLGQLLVVIVYLVILYCYGATSMYIPFLGRFDLANTPLAIVFWVVGIFIVYGTVNAVNLTDGIDGLCSSVTFVAAVALLVFAAVKQYVGVNTLAACLVGGCAGFLVWNWHPAKAFMGDTGSMFMGGLVVALAYALDCPLILLPIGIIYIVETMSVIIQVTYFKKTGGKRLFKMSPIHHHFEMSGWSEVKIVGVFSLITLIGCIVAAVLLYFGGYFEVM
ncbi:MAG: phospho-N-acetylmuramoyl-pentapeptide-transferase [Clostridia bacterium]|nr:phospho-N-acetylmuramoyl-pentapeptide-transferase [Clostridia bacterium]